jgi:hypothetical protein
MSAAKSQSPGASLLVFQNGTVVLADRTIDEGMVIAPAAG